MTTAARVPTEAVADSNATWKKFAGRGGVGLVAAAMLIWVLPKALLAAGFGFGYGAIDAALAALVSPQR